MTCNLSQLTDISWQKDSSAKADTEMQNDGFLTDTSYTLLPSDFYAVSEYTPIPKTTEFSISLNLLFKLWFSITARDYIINQTLKCNECIVTNV